MSDHDPMFPFRVDPDDEARASDGVSRYGAYLQQHTRTFADIDYDDPTVEFAATAWRIACSPIMSPPYVLSHPRVMSASIQRSDWDGGLTADVYLVSDRPASLRLAKTTAGAYYQDWATDSWGEYEAVSGSDLARRPYLLTQVQVLIQFLPGTLPTLDGRPGPYGELLRMSKEYVNVLIGVLNREIAPIIEQMEK